MIKRLITDLRDIAGKVKNQVSSNKLFTETPDEVKTLKQKAGYWFFKHWYIMSQGKGNVLGRFTTVFTELGFLVAFLEYYTFINFNATGVVLFVGFGYIACWMMGYVYMRLDLDWVESMVGFQRQYIQKQMYTKLLKKKSKKGG